MATKIPQRLLWAVEVLAVQPDDQILEIGCGHGVAVSLICEKLGVGKITAIDQSEKMIETAKHRNKRCVALGRAVFHTVSLREANFPSGQFNKIFAVNVNVFWLNPAQELSVLKKLLLPTGILYLFYEPPTASKSTEIAEKVTRNFQNHGFSMKETLFNDDGVCIVASPSR
jgi:SAM-dependent methyltransferase